MGLRANRVVLPERPTASLRLLGAVLLPVLLAPAVGAEGPGGAGTGQELAPVIVAEARPESVADRIEALGTAHAVESVQITSDVTEKVVEIHFPDGQSVSAGDLLVVLDKAEEEADLTGRAGRA